jgi:glycerol-3-phosphate dehydrogenase (NAD(P)+)
VKAVKSKQVSAEKKSREKISESLDVLILGGGSFGTAIGTLLANNGRKVMLWVNRAEQVKEINGRHTNKNYFPDLYLPSNLRATTDLKKYGTVSEILCFAVPTKYFREVARQVGDFVTGDQILVHVAKGIEPHTYKRMSEILREETCALKIGVLSGPTLAKELMAGQPAGALVASHFEEVVSATQKLFQGSPLRLYGGSDVIGTEIGGAFKNIIALLAGAAAGMGFGENTKALLVTRGLSEMAQYGVANGADVFTFGGLAGVGDLMATCFSPLSRNHQVGRRLAQGETLEKILATSTQVAEGVSTTKVIYHQAIDLRLDLPLVRAAYRVLYEGVTLTEALQELNERPLGKELVRLLHR